MLKITNLTKTYGPRSILNSINFTAEPQTITVIFGAPETGKTTLLRIIAQLESANSGSIESTGAIEIIFQDLNLSENMTALHTITSALEKNHRIERAEAQSIAHDILEKNNLLDKKNEYPNKLSRGQKQRLAIARALTNRPSVICFDEPTSILDPILTNSIAQMLIKLTHENYTVLITTNDHELIKKIPCSCYILEKGSIIKKY